MRITPQKQIAGVKLSTKTNKVLKLIAKPQSYLYRELEYLERYDGSAKNKIIQLIEDCYLPMILSVEDPLAKDLAISSVNKLRAIENMIRERYGLIRSAETIPGLSGIVEPQKQLTNSLLIPESVKESSEKNQLDLLEQPEIEEKEAPGDYDIDPETEDLQAKFKDMGVLYG